MTFQVVSVADAKETVLGTVWADAQAHAEWLALNFYTADEQSVRIRRGEEREIPMRIAEPALTSPFLS
jgi:heme-degrading monooxygenase HmoA